MPVEIDFENDWFETSTEIFERIQKNDPMGEEMLYEALRKTHRPKALSKFGYEKADECLHDIFIYIVRQIKRDAIKTPCTLMHYAKTILHYRWVNEIQTRNIGSIDTEKCSYNISDKSPNPEQCYEISDRKHQIQKAMKRLKDNEREIIVRFYLEEQTAEFIQQEMRLTSTQFRLLKHRSKDKLVAFMQKQMNYPLKAVA